MQGLLGLETILCGGGEEVAAGMVLVAEMPTGCQPGRSWLPWGEGGSPQWDNIQCMAYTQNRVAVV